MMRRITEAADAYDTLSRLLAAERASSKLRLERAQAESDLLREQLAQARAAEGELLAALEEMQQNELDSLRELTQQPIKAAARPASSAASSPAAAAQEAQQWTMPSLKMFGM